ncbi:hypothetical protein V6N13_012187 [Hibiscus sabdariffa]|uniref:Response regulatory domain-containing protein n=1 Tax=Hibiscus sabdariffa TaxID=183260 RepID=A0ABR2SF83_9ROSI
MELMKSDNIVQDRDRQPRQGEIMQRQKQEEEEEEEERRFHVLAVDDSVIDRKLLEKLLKAFSCQVTCLESGEKALEYLGLLHNSATPASSSSSSSSSQQHQGSSWKDVPVVVMSSENVPSRISMCLEGGAEEFMLKPLQLSDLHKIQARILKSLPHS